MRRRTYGREPQNFDSCAGLAAQHTCHPGLPLAPINRIALVSCSRRVLDGSRNVDLIGCAMDEERFNLSLRRFLKEVGITSQREIERLVREGAPDGAKLRVRMVLTAEGTDLHHEVDGEIETR